MGTLSADRRPAPFAGTDPDAVDQVQHEDLTVPDLPLAAPGALVDRGDRRLDEFLVHGDVETDLPQQPANLLGAAIDLRV